MPKAETTQVKPKAKAMPGLSVVSVSILEAAIENMMVREEAKA